jgi:hypothetical protein
MISKILLLLIIVYSSTMLAGVIDCENTCTGQLNPNYRLYMPPAQVNAQDLKDITQCFHQGSHYLLSGFTDEELRGYFEITGKLLAKEIKVKPNDFDEESEVQALKKAVWSGYSKYVWGVGTTDCYDHAIHLKKHLEAQFNNKQYRFEVVNTFQDIDDESGAPDFNGSLSPMANHYLVRAVSMQTGLSYIVDGYTVPSVNREKDLKKEKIILNPYEECFYAPVMKAMYNLDPNEDVLGMLASFTPVVKSFVARETKRVANACLRGKKKVTVSK